jgi:putative drug exporter of the RND superfamily
MSRALGQFVVRFKFVLLAVWVLAAIWMATQAPSLKDVAISETSQFLPDSSPSVQAQKAINAAFPGEDSQGSAILVFHRAGGLNDADTAYAKAVGEWLASGEQPQVVNKVTSIFNTPGAESLLVSPDKSTLLMNLGFSSEPFDTATTDALKAIRAHIAANSAPQGLAANMTGAAAISGDEREQIFEGVDRTAIVTILLVVVVLLLIYRSPVAAFAPLFTIGMAYIVARGVLGYMAQAGMQVSSFVDNFIIVIIFGVGTDYCLFIISRFREELGRQSTRPGAIIVSMSAIGAVISASAATVIVALMLMMTAKFGMLTTIGPAMAAAVFVTLLAGLTLTPAVIAILGHYLFWPRHDEVDRHETSRLWRRIADIATQRSGLVAVVVIAVLLLPYLALPQMSRSFNIFAELPKKTDSVVGYNNLAKGFEPGELMPVSVVLSNGGGILSDLDRIARFTSELEAAPQVDRVRSLIQPSGDAATAATFHIDSQIKQAASGLGTLVASLDDPAKASQQGSGQQSGSMSDLSAFLADIGTVPQVAKDPAYSEAVSRTKSVDAGLAQLASASRLSAQVDSISKQMAGLAQTIKASSTATQTATTQTATATNPASQLGDLTTYLTQLGQAYPAIAKETSYQDSLQALKALGDDLTKAQQMTLVSNQLGLLAGQLQQLSQALSTPMGALALAGGSSQELQTLAGYLTDLGKAVPSIAVNPSYQNIMTRLARLDAATKQMQATPPTDLTAALTALKQEVDGLTADVVALQKAVAAQTPPPTFVPQNMAALAGAQAGIATPDPAKSAQRLADSLAVLSAVAKTQMPTATFMPTGIPLNDDMRQALAKLKQDATALQAAMNKLAADTGSGEPIHFLPQSALKDPKIADALSYFLSKDGNSTRLTMVLKAVPYSAQSDKDIVALEPIVQKAAAAAGLHAVMGGAPVAMSDVQQAVNSDFLRIALFTLVGVFIVLVLLLRSLVAPIYLVLTVLLSVGATLGLCTFVFQDVLGQSGVNYIVPIIVFVLLVALGADYNIFLMSRVREEAETKGTKEGIRIASAYTGSIITSCGIILAGTFAAMMVAPIQMLFQIGFAVAVGVLLDTFVIRAVLVPAIASILGEWNWWPTKLKSAK